MSVKNLIMASVATRGVFRKFAQLSDEEKEEVVKKVKEKMNVQDDESDDEDADTETDTEQTEGEPAESPDEEGTPEGDDGEDEEEEGENGEGDDEDTEEVEEIEPEPEEEPEEEPEGEPEEEPEGEPEGEPEEEPEEPVEDGIAEPQNQSKIEEIVDGLVEEVQTIKQDGQISQKEVLGLITNMMEMVNLLVQAKPPTRRRKRGSITREFEIAMRVAGSEIQVGKLVKYSQNFLRMISDPHSVQYWTGLVKSVRQVGSRTVAEVAWNSGETREVDMRNLSLIPRSESLLHRYSTKVVDTGVV